jgi:SAM-dependent methyltransferase
MIVTDTNVNGQFEFQQIVCPVCGADDHRTVGVRGGRTHHSGQGVETTIVRCLKCTHQYPNPMPFPNVPLDELYSNADEYFERHDLEEKKLKGRELISDFEKRLGEKGTFLDVGCGRGELLWAAKEAGWQYDGVDPSKDFIQFGKQQLGVEGHLGTLAEMKFADNSFDAIAMSGIIEHLYDPAELLSEIHRLLRPDGWLFFDAPNEDGLYMKIGNTYMRVRGKQQVVVLAPTFSPYHVQGFNPASLKVLLDKLKFDLKDFRIFGNISPQTGEQTLRKTVEYRAAQLINGVGNAIGYGMYMEVWAKKRKV